MLWLNLAIALTTLEAAGHSESAGQKTPTSPGSYPLTGTWTPTGAAAANYLPTPGTADIALD